MLVSKTKAIGVDAEVQYLPTAYAAVPQLEDLTFSENAVCRFESDSEQYTSHDDRGGGKEMPTVDIAKTGQNIRKRAEEAGMTMKDVADICGVTPQAASKWGRTCLPTIDAIVVMAHIWHITIEEIIAIKVA